MSAAGAIDRRSFLKLAAVAGGGLAIGCFTAPRGLAGASASVEEKAPGPFAPNAFIRIAPDGAVSIVSARPEIGQGIRTSLPMVVAEELGADWRRVTVAPAALDPVFGQQSAVGSNSTPNSYEEMRKMGAAARMMLVAAAAAAWGVPVGECTAAGGSVRHVATARSLGFGELADRAARIPVPADSEIVLKDPKDFTLLGSRVGGIDNGRIVRGEPLFGLDERRPGMVFAVYEKCPVWGGRPVEANLEHVKSLPGVRDAFIVDRTVPEGVLTGLVPGVAIVADSTWSAFSARRELKVTWDEGPFAESSWEGYLKEARALAASPDGPGTTQARKDGDVEQAFAKAASVVEAEYTYPFIAHTNLEPQNCTAEVKGDRAEIWVPTQDPGEAQNLAAQVLSIPAANIRVNITRIGGGFGRRLDPDPVAEAVAIAQRVGAPVKLVWDRTDDLQHDHYRPGGFHFMKGAVDDAGRVSAWRCHHVSFASKVYDSIMGPEDYPARFLPNFLLLHSRLENGVPQGPWRALGNGPYTWVVCSFIDELAYAAGRDPLAFHLALMGDKDVVPGGGPGGQPYDAGRMRRVVREAAERAGWGSKLPRGRGMGLGYTFCQQGYIAEVAEVTVSRGGELRVDRVVAAVDVGSQIVNLSAAENQVQGSIIDGINAAWRQEIDIQRGRAVQSNFHEYQMLRLPDAPRSIDVHFVRSPHPPTGLGEPALPPIAPAVCNAIFAATGKRVRQFPLSRSDLSWA
jgi:isoquinoline 1-oxidoreductase beta subunit